MDTFERQELLPGLDPLDGRYVVWVPNSLFDAGDELFRQHREAVARTVRADERFRRLKARRDRVWRTRERGGGGFGDGTWHHPREEELTQEVERLQEEAEAALAERNEAKAEAEALAEEIRKDFTALHGRSPRLVTEDSVQL